MLHLGQCCQIKQYIWIFPYPRKGLDNIVAYAIEFIAISQSIQPWVMSIHTPQPRRGLDQHPRIIEISANNIILNRVS